MTIAEVYEVENNRVIINLPAEFQNGKKLFITVNGVTDRKAVKLAALEKVGKDPSFLPT